MFNRSVSSSIVDTVGMKMGMNCGPMLPFMPTVRHSRFLLAQVAPLHVWV